MTALAGAFAGTVASVVTSPGQRPRPARRERPGGFLQLTISRDKIEGKTKAGKGKSAFQESIEIIMA
jgi:hypothetical protein